MSVLVVEGVRKTFREGRETVEVLRGIDMTLEAGYALGEDPAKPARVH